MVETSVFIFKRYPYCLAFDSQRNLFFSTPQSNSVFKATIIDGALTFLENILPELNYPMGIAFNNNHLYSANFSINSILKTVFNPDGTIQATTPFVINLNLPNSLAFDSNNNMFVSNSDGTITKTIIDEFGNAISTSVFYTSSVGDPVCIAFDKYGNLFYSCQNKIIKITINLDGQIISSDVFLSLPDGTNSTYSISCLTFDTSGNLFYTAEKYIYSPIHIRYYYIYKATINPNGEIVSNEISIDSNLLKMSAGLTFDSEGNLFCANNGNSTITKTEGISLENNITVEPSFAKTFGNIPFNLDATSLNTNYAKQPLLYSSDAENVATVEQNGLVTLHGAGTAIITINQNAGTNYTSATAISTIVVQDSEASNPTIIENGVDLEYFMESDAQYAELDNSVQITSDLIATNQKTVVTNGISVSIIKVEPG